jgi:histidinol phosphatase-like PHP family hydrolase
MMFDFHTHTFFSDGELLPSELIRRVYHRGYDGIALTDHVDFSNVEHVLKSQKKVKETWEKADIEVLVGVEITHVPPEKIAKLVSLSRRLEADVVVVHGETIVEPVCQGTNLASVTNPDVDILAHPGILSLEEAEAAKENGVFLEITSRFGHNSANGLVAGLALKAGADIILNTDAHGPSDIISDDYGITVLKASGVPEGESRRVLRDSPKKLIQDI